MSILGKRNKKKTCKKKLEKNTRGKLQCFKEKTKKTKISTNSIAKKIKSTKIILKKNKAKKKIYVKNDNFGKKKRNKKTKKNMWGKLKIYYQPAQY